MTNSLQGVTSNRYMFHLTWPIFIELVLQMLVGNADQIMVSQYSTQSVGAIGNANQITNLLIISFSVISMAFHHFNFSVHWFGEPREGGADLYRFSGAESYFWPIDQFDSFVVQ